MTEEEYFRKNYPDSCYGDKPLSPHFDFFQDGVEFGERECEKKIQELEAKYYSVGEIAHHRGMCCISALRENRELEKRIAELEKACDETQELLDKQIEATFKLDKENAELKEKLKEHENVGNAQFWENVWSWKTKAEQLTKAKEIIKYLCGMVRELNKPNVQLTNVDYSLSEAEQFIKDSEVEK